MVRAAAAHGHRMDAGWTIWDAERTTRSVRAANAKDGGRFWSTVPIGNGLCRAVGCRGSRRWEAERSARGACRHPVDERAGSHGAESAMRARPRAAGTCGERLTDRPTNQACRSGGIGTPPRLRRRGQAPPYRLRVRRSSTAICAGALMLPGRSEPSSSTGCRAECSAPVLLGRRSERDVARGGRAGSPAILMASRSAATLVTCARSCPCGSSCLR